jgi:hypothetical protein
MSQIERQGHERGVEELCLVDTDDFNLIDLREESRLECFNIGDGNGVQGL